MYKEVLLTALPLFTKISFYTFILESNKEIKIHKLSIKTIRFIDDIVFIANDKYGLQQVKDHTQHKIYKIKINEKKKRVMVCTRIAHTIQTNITIDGKKLEEVYEYIYLESKMS